MTADARRRLQKIELTIQAQKSFMHRIPDPDTRERAEEHLIILVQMRDVLIEEARSTQAA